MWTIVAFIMAIVFIAFIIYSLSSNKKNYNANRYIQSKRNIRCIDDCISFEDIQYELSSSEIQIMSAIRNSKNDVQKVLTMANSTINVAWLNSFEKIIKISSNLYCNLNYCTQRNLENSKFQYYCSLHFRSMIAADIVHKEFMEIESSYSEINNLILNLKNSFSNNKKISKNTIYEVKDNIKAVRQIFLNRVQKMNKHTANLRDKIGNECGERGRKWRAERMRYR